MSHGKQDIRDTTGGNAPTEQLEPERDFVRPVAARTLTDVVTDADDTRVALRCIEGSSEHLVVDDIKITALEVGTVTG